MSTLFCPTHFLVPSGAYAYIMLTIDHCMLPILTSNLHSIRCQSFQRRILGMKWYDKITNTAIKETTGLMDLTSIIANRRHSLLVRSADYLHTHYIYPLLPSPAHLLPQTGSAHGERNPGSLVVEIAMTPSRSAQQ